MKPRRALPVTVFYSYAHEDEDLRNHLERHLSLLEHEGLIRHWHDRLIPVGTERLQAIGQALEEASIILLLISSDFFASHHCYKIEMPCALRRHWAGISRTIPIILRPCDWHTAPFAGLECLPCGGKAVTEWDDQDAAFSNIAWNIRCTLNLPTFIYQHSLHTCQPFLKYILSGWRLDGLIQQKYHLRRRFFKILVAGSVIVIFKILRANQFAKYICSFLSGWVESLKCLDNYLPQTARSPCELRKSCYLCGTIHNDRRKITAR